MSKNNENKLIPKLRFPEFINSNEWDEKPLGNISNRITEKNSDGEIKNVFTNSAVDGIVDQRDFFDKDIADKASLENYYVVKDGDYVYNPRISNIAPVGPISKNKTGKSGAMSPLYTVFRFVDKNNEFYEYYFKTRHWFNAIRKVSNTGARFDRMSITDSVFMSIPVLVPSPKEQKKIAACLSSLDKVITAESQKLEVLKDHKKGLLQNLLPQAGETVPKFRFKEFVDSGEWVESSVEGNCLVKGRIGYRGYTTNDLVNQGEGALVLGGKHIQNQTLDLSDPTYLSWEKYYESPEIMVEIGDIIFSQRGTLGDCAIIEEEIGPATINPSMVLLKNITCNSKFLYYILIGDRIQNEVKKSKGLGAIPMLSQKQIREFSFLIPHNLEEQQKVASALSSIDDLIKAQIEKVEALQQHKKGLLQGLFPNVSPLSP